jgi:hypothetical protein
MANLVLDALMSGYSSTDTLNSNFEEIEYFADGVLARDGSDSMQGDLDMDSNRILNLPDALSPSEPLTLRQAADITAIPGFVTNAGVVTYTDYQSNNTTVKDHLDRGAEGISYTPAGAEPVTDVQTRLRALDSQVGVADSIDVTYTPAGTGAVATNVQDKLRETISVKDFGAVGDGVADDYAAFKAAVDSGITRLYVPQGVYALSQTVEVPVGVYLDCAGAAYDEAPSQGTLFVPVAASTSYREASGSLTANGYLFFMNVAESDPTTWIDQFPNIGSGGINNCNVDGTATGGIKFAYFAGGYEFENIYTTKVYTAVRAVDSLYQDHIKVKRVFGRQRPDQTTYFVILDCLGDALEVDDVAAGYTGNESGTTKGVHIGLCRGGRVTNLINGSHKVVGAKALVLSGLHQEGGNLTIDSANVHITDSIFFNAEDDAIPIRLENSLAGSNQRYSVSVDNVTFSKTITKGGWSATEIPDIALINTGISLQLGRGCRRTISESGAIANSQVMGIIVREADSSITTWRNYSHFLTAQGSVVEAGETDITGHTTGFENNFGGFASISLATYGSGASAATFKAATDTYFYGLQLIIDPVRLLGRSADITAEVSASPTLSGTGLPTMIINLNAITSHGGYMLRLYRGTSTGSYDNYIDIPAISVKRLIDDGNAVNGFVWRSRTAGAMDTLNAKAWSGSCQWVDDRVVIHGKSSTPTAGTWKIGDQCIRTDTTVDGNNMHLRGYFRLTDGSGHVPGTDWAPEQISTVSPAT